MINNIGYIPIIDGTIEDILTSTSVVNALSANQGKNLKDDADNLSNIVSSITKQQSDRGFVSVKDFGALGNYSADDTQKIKDAISYADVNDLNVYLPKGIYKVTSTITIPSGIKFFGDGGLNQISVIRQVGDFNCFELIGGYYSGGIEGIHITGENSNGATNIAIYVLRTIVKLYDISIGSYKGIGIKMDGSIVGGTGCWFSSINKIKIIGCLISEVSYTTIGLYLGENCNDFYLNDFTIQQCKTSGIECYNSAGLHIVHGNLSDNDDNVSLPYAIRVLAGKNIKISDIYIEANTNGILISGGDTITLENIYNQGALQQNTFLEIPSESLAKNITVKNCYSHRNTQSDIKTISNACDLKIIDSQLLSTTPIINTGFCDINITDGVIVKKHESSSSSAFENASRRLVVITTVNKTLTRHDSNKTIITNLAALLLITLPTYQEGLHYKIIMNKGSGTTDVSTAVYAGFNAETGLITNSLRCTGLGSIELFGLGDHWVVLSQKGVWAKI